MMVVEFPGLLGPFNFGPLGELHEMFSRYTANISKISSSNLLVPITVPDIVDSVFFSYALN
jgi:hypothetical protein